MARLSPVPFPRIDFDPPRYGCRYAAPFAVDGNLDKAVWQAAPWTDDFADIEGPSMPTPRQRTRAKMLWSDECLYIGVELHETHIWATLTQRDCVIYHDNDIEFFFDPSGTTHEYGEVEINALGTVWDLFLTKPYRDGGTPVDGYDIKGLKVGIQVDGEINNPAVDNRRWCIEVAIPWASVFGDGDRSKPPVPGDFWRMNLSRVTWRTEVVDGAYRKVINPETGRPYPEDNWVWAPTGVINIHYPELWGYVYFLKEGMPLPGLCSIEQDKWRLRRLYYHQRAYNARNGRFAASLAELDADEAGPIVEATRDLFQITLPAADGKGAHAIRQDGYVWKLDDWKGEDAQ